MEKIKILLRFMAFPFVLGLILISYNYAAIKRAFYFLKYGGEFINYEKNEQIRIHDIYLELKKKKDKRGN
jgi:hypothetical protein